MNLKAREHIYTVVFLCLAGICAKFSYNIQKLIKIINRHLRNKNSFEVMMSMYCVAVDCIY